MDYIKKINRLKKDKNAVILAHYYTLSEIQEIADYVGDSYYLSKIAKELHCELIVFCGVRFMAESVKLLSPNKKVLIPNNNATCQMARQVELSKVKKLLKDNSDGVLVSYINSSTELKAISYTCCTSSSAKKIISNIDNKKIVFVPDRNLGSYINESFESKDFILWDGCCNVHNNIHSDSVIELKNKYPNAKILVHPECRKKVRDIADFIGSTSEIINFATENKANEFIVVTDIGILYELKIKNPNKNFYEMPINCKNMKCTNIKNVYNCLLEEKNEININDELSKKAVKALEMMHKLG